MQLAIHPQAKDAFNRRADEILTDVFRRPVQRRGTTNNIDKPDFFISHTYNDGDITSIKESLITPDGETVLMHQVLKSEEIGLEEEGYRKLCILVEKVYVHQNISKHISTRQITDIAFDWLVKRVAGDIDVNFLDFTVPILEKSITDLNVLIPIFDLSTTFQFPCANTTITQLDSLFFDQWEKDIHLYPNVDPDARRRLIQSYRKDLQGCAACMIKIQAEARRACEIALEETESALDLLRFFASKSTMNINLPSFLRPVGYHNIDKSLVFTIVNGQPPLWHSEFRHRFSHTVLDKEHINIIYQAGFGALHEMYLRENKTDFQKDLINSLTTYSRSLLQREISGRLIFAFTALDSFLLKDQNENIQQNIAERIAFTISDDAQERIKIRNTVIATYGYRSRAVHHNQSIQEIELLNQFLQYIFRFYLLMIGRNMRYKSRQDLLNEIEQAKFS